LKISIHDIQGVGAEPIQLFYDGIKSASTKESYTRTLKRIFCEMLEDVLHGTFEERAAEFVKKSKQDPEYALGIMLAISRMLKKRTELAKTDKDYMNPSTFSKYFKPIKKLLDMNGVPIVWNRIYATYPERNNNQKGRAYNIAEIRKTLEFSNGAIDRAIILIASSSSIRAGAFTLRWKDIQPVYKLDGKFTLNVTESEVKRAEIVCGVMNIYAETDSEHPAFITPEAYNAVMSYRSEWTREVGREPKDTEPIFKQEGDLPRMLAVDALRRRVARVLQAAGLRPPLPKGQKRHEVPAMNGFRRFFNKCAKDAVSEDSTLGELIKKEYMMGHTGLVKTDRNYYQSHLFELVREYLNIVPSLTVNNEERERLEKEKALQENQELHQEKTLMKDLAKDIREVKLQQERHQVINQQEKKDLLKKIADLESKLNKS